MDFERANTYTLSLTHLQTKQWIHDNMDGLYNRLFSRWESDVAKLKSLAL